MSWHNVEQNARIVERLDKETWCMHIAPLLGVIELVKLAGTGDGILLDWLQSARGPPFDAAGTSAKSRLAKSLVQFILPSRMRSIPLCAKYLQLYFASTPSLGCRTILESDLPMRCGLEAVKIGVGRYGLSNVLALLGKCPNLRYLSLHVLYNIVGIKCVPPLESSALVGFKRVQNVVLSTVRSEAMTPNDVRQFAYLPSLQSFYTSCRFCSSATYSVMPSFQTLHSLRLDNLAIYDGFDVELIPRTITLLQLYFQTSPLISQWKHGNLPPNLTRLTLLSSCTLYAENVEDKIIGPTTRCPNTITRLSFGLDIAHFIDRLAPAAQDELEISTGIVSLNQLVQCSISVPRNDHQTLSHRYISRLPPSCTKLKIYGFEIEHGGDKVLANLSNSIKQLDICNWGNLYFIPRFSELQTLCFMHLKPASAEVLAKFCRDVGETTRTTIYIENYAKIAEAYMNQVYSIINPSTSSGWFIIVDMQGISTSFFKGIPLLAQPKDLQIADQ